MSRRLIESLSTNRTVQVKEAGIRVPMAVISGYVRASCHTAHRHARVRAYKPLSALRVTFADMQLEPARKRKERGTYFESGNCRRACIERTTCLGAHNRSPVKLLFCFEIERGRSVVKTPKLKLNRTATRSEKIQEEPRINLEELHRKNSRGLFIVQCANLPLLFTSFAMHARAQSVSKSWRAAQYRFCAFQILQDSS